MFWALELATKFEDFLWRRLTIIASEDIGPADSSMAILIETLHWQYVDVRKKSTKPMELPMLAHAIIALCRAPKSRVADDLACLVAHQRDNEGLRREIPDYALDQHTGRGKQLKRGWDHWAHEGSKIENEAMGLNPYRERTLALWKTHGKLKERERKGGAKDESPLFDEE